MKWVKKESKHEMWDLIFSMGRCELYCYAGGNYSFWISILDAEDEIILYSEETFNTPETLEDAQNYARQKAIDFFHKLSEEFRNHD